MNTHISFIKILLLFFKMGTVTFGGGVTMAPLLMKEVVEKRGWIDEEQLTEGFALSQSLPGIVAVNISVYIGYRLRGLPGAVIASAASAAPAVIGIIAVVALLDALPIENLLAEGLKGVKSASVALILCTASKMGKTILHDKWDKLLFLGALIGSMFFQINGILLVCSFALLGFVCYQCDKRKRRKDV